jgi:hypothetical protein
MLKGPETHEQISIKWRNRRWMAWITFIFDHILISYIVLYAQNIEQYISLISTFFAMSGSIIASYIGFATWDDINRKNQETGLDRSLIDNGIISNNSPSPSDESNSSQQNNSDEK